MEIDECTSKNPAFNSWHLVCNHGENLPQCEQHGNLDQLTVQMLNGFIALLDNAIENMQQVLQGKFNFEFISLNFRSFPSHLHLQHHLCLFLVLEQEPPLQLPFQNGH